MNTLPPIGSRVRFKGSLANGPCNGTVTAYYPTDRHDENGDPIPGLTAPEREWHVCLEVERLPKKWAYAGTNKIAPRVSDLRQL